MKNVKPPSRVVLRLGGYTNMAQQIQLGSNIQEPLGHYKGDNLALGAAALLAKDLKSPKRTSHHDATVQTWVHYLIGGRFKVAQEFEPPCCDRSNMGAQIYWIIIWSLGGFQLY